MAYGLSTRLFLENGPAAEAAKVPERSSATAHAVLWQKLKRDERLSLIDGELKKAA